MAKLHTIFLVILLCETAVGATTNFFLDKVNSGNGIYKEMVDTQNYPCQAQTIQKACVVARKKAESQLKSCQSMIQAKDKELTEVLNELAKAKGLLAKLGAPGYAGPHKLVE
ncbi:hypothetical protein Fot_37352 [Forsythia ovata]|uniref:Uncharacterized protein n=1 Tax=Forsythia ovata TaxID=205694 RepID=A0ABD1RYR5_9LAMI